MRRMAWVTAQITKLKMIRPVPALAGFPIYILIPELFRGQSAGRNAISPSLA